MSKLAQVLQLEPANVLVFKGLKFYIGGLVLLNL